MNEIYEFRIPENNALRFNLQNGKLLGSTVRVIRVNRDDPLYNQIGKLEKWMQNTEKKSFFFGWSIDRRYSKQELNASRLLTISTISAFEPTGEECGTIYDYSSICPRCGAGRQQLSDLKLDLNKIAKKKNIAKTIANEWIIDQAFAQLLVDNEITGFQLKPVIHVNRSYDEQVAIENLKVGKEIINKAEIAGYPYPHWSFWVWINRPENKYFVDKLVAENRNSQRENMKIFHHQKWYQLVINANPINAIPPTLFGIHPFDLDVHGSYKCIYGHVSGLNLLSELYVDESTWDKSDIVNTTNLIGIRRGLLYPSPLILFSKKLFNLCIKESIHGLKFEVANLI